MTDLTITSVRNPRVQAARELRERRERERARAMLIDGTREIERAVAAGVEIIELFVCWDLLARPEQRVLVDRLREAHVPIIAVSEPVFAKLAYGERAEGIVAVARTPQTTLSALKLPERPLVCVLEGCEKPGNLGAVLRSADGAGLSAVIVADSRTDLFNPNTIRASLGTIFTVPVAAASTAETLAWLREREMAIVAARVEAEREYSDVNFAGATAIVLGSEADGLTDAWRAPDITPVRLPMHGVADSLNVSATAAILFYEALRQRR